jgi:hypothetical protein
MIKNSFKEGRVVDEKRPVTSIISKENLSSDVVSLFFYIWFPEWLIESATIELH